MNPARPRGRAFFGAGGHAGRAKRLKSGAEPFHAGGASIGPTLLDCWRWSNSDLLSNAWRGVLAEFLIASALGLAGEPRIEWAAYDLRTRSGVAVEVKSAAYQPVVKVGHSGIDTPALVLYTGGHGDGHDT